MKLKEGAGVILLMFFGGLLFTVTYQRLTLELQETKWKYSHLVEQMQALGKMEQLAMEHAKNQQLLNLTETLQSMEAELGATQNDLHNLNRALEFRALLNHTTLPAMKVDPSVVLDPARMQYCRDLAFDETVDKFDVVMLWINMSEAGYTDWPPKYEGDARGRPYAGVGRDRPPYSELVFSLRAMEQNGMMRYVNKIFIVYDDTRHGPPMFFYKNQDTIRAVPHSELVAGTKFVNRFRRLHTTLAYLHHIPDLGEFFVFMNDDQLLMSPFDLETLYDNKSKQMLMHLPTKMGQRPGWSDFSRILLEQFGPRDRKLDIHCPFMCKRCLLEEMEAMLANDYHCNPAHGPLICELNFHFNSFAQNYAIDRKAALAVAATKTRCKEIHTLPKQKPASLEHQLQRTPVGMQWINLQGPGVSDEYVRMDWVRQMVDDFYFETFPNRSSFELPDYMPS